MIEFEKYKLLNNPFRISPAINSSDLIWVGMKQLQTKLDARMESSIKTSPSRIVLNWGRYGSGKTHAANFYTKTNHIESLLKARTKNLKVNLPRSSKEPVQAFLRALVGQLNFDNIVNDFKEFKATFKEESEGIIDANTQDAIIAQFIKLFLGQQPAGNALFEKVETLLPKDAMQNFLYGDGSKTTLNKLGIPLGLDDDEQVVNLISGIFNSLTHEKKLYKCVFLWIDEFEDIDTLPKSSQDRFTTFLRQLIDKAPNNLTIFLNFTLKGVGEFEDLSIILGEALASRTKLFIDFESATHDEGMEYIRTLINHPNFRKKGDVKSESPYYPMSETVVDYILKNIGRLSIRRINETFSLILELALIEKEIPSEINLEFIHSIKGEIPGWKP